MPRWDNVRLTIKGYNPSRRDYRVDTTALVITIGDNERTVFYILEGNHSQQYAKYENLKDCVKYFMSNKEHAHEFSDAFEHECLFNEEEL